VQLLQQNISPLRSTLVDGSTIGTWQWAHVSMAVWAASPVAYAAQLSQQNALPARSTIVEWSVIVTPQWAQDACGIVAPSNQQNAGRRRRRCARRHLVDSG